MSTMFLLAAGSTGSSQPAPVASISTSACGAADSGAVLQAAIDSAGPGGRVHLPACPVRGPQPNCYRIRTTLRILNHSVLEGDGDNSCIEADTPAGRPALLATDIESLSIRDIAILAGPDASVGLQMSGGRLDTVLSLIENVFVAGFHDANISLRHTYGIVFMNVRSRDLASGTPSYGLRMEDGYNNAITIIGGEFRSTREAAVYVGSGGTGLSMTNVVVEANQKHGIQIKAPYFGIQLNNAYFEQNGARYRGCDLDVPFAGNYDVSVVGLSVRNANFNAVNCAGSIESASDPEFSASFAPLSAPGAVAGSKNTIVFGRSVWRPHLSGNQHLYFVNGAGAPLFDLPSTTSENRYRSSEALDNTAWLAEPRMRAQNTVRYLNGEPAWSLGLAAGGGPAHTSAFGQTLGSNPGALIGVGAWMRTDADTATVTPDIGGVAVYSGSTLNQPNRMQIDTSWRWVWTSATVAASDSGPVLAGWRAYANSQSRATAVYVYHPQAWANMANGPPLYAGTRDNPVIMTSPGQFRAPDTK